MGVMEEEEEEKDSDGSNLLLGVALTNIFVLCEPPTDFHSFDSSISITAASVASSGTTSLRNILRILQIFCKYF